MPHTFEVSEVAAHAVGTAIFGLCIAQVLIKVFQLKKLPQIAPSKKVQKTGEQEHKTALRFEFRENFVGSSYKKYRGVFTIVPQRPAANGKPHYKTEAGGHLYYSVTGRWYLNKEFTPDATRAIATFKTNGAMPGEAVWEWWDGKNWVTRTLKTIDLSTEIAAAEMQANRAVNGLHFRVPEKVNFLQDLQGIFLVDTDHPVANGRPHYKTAAGTHLYFSSNQRNWYVSDKFTPDRTLTCMLFTSEGEVPQGEQTWRLWDSKKKEWVDLQFTITELLQSTSAQSDSSAAATSDNQSKDEQQQETADAIDTKEPMSAVRFLGLPRNMELKFSGVFSIDEETPTVNGDLHYKTEAGGHLYRSKCGKKWYISSVFTPEDTKALAYTYSSSAGLYMGEETSLFGMESTHMWEVWDPKDKIWSTRKLRTVDPSALFLLGDSPLPAFDQADSCFECDVTFTFMRRRHHCRVCGHTFCAKHSSTQRQLPVLPGHSTGSTVRVCDNCATKVDCAIAEREHEIKHQRKNSELAIATRDLIARGILCEFVEVVHNQLKQDIQVQMREKFLCGSRGCLSFENLEVLRVLRVQNADLWHDFCVHQSRLCRFRGAEFASTFSDWYSANQALSTTLQQAMTAATPCIEGCSTNAHRVPVLRDDWNTVWLWHGTTPATALIVAEFGTDQRVADLNGLYGAGSYFADNCCKAHQYRGTSFAFAKQHGKESPSSVDANGHHCMLLCRVAMGVPYHTKKMHKNERRPPDNAATPGRPFDSIFAATGVANGGKQKHNEFVVFSSAQVSPEFLIYYTI